MWTCFCRLVKFVEGMLVFECMFSYFCRIMEIRLGYFLKVSVLMLTVLFSCKKKDESLRFFYLESVEEQDLLAGTAVKCENEYAQFDSDFNPVALPENGIYSHVPKVVCQKITGDVSVSEINYEYIPDNMVRITVSGDSGRTDTTFRLNSKGYISEYLSGEEYVPYEAVAYSSSGMRTRYRGIVLASDAFGYISADSPDGSWVKYDYGISAPESIPDAEKNFMRIQISGVPGARYGWVTGLFGNQSKYLPVAETRCSDGVTNEYSHTYTFSAEGLLLSDEVFSEGKAVRKVIYSYGEGRILE